MQVVANGEITIIGWIVLFATSSLVSGIATWSLNTFMEWRKTGQHQKFAGLYVATTFERFADDCATRIGESESYDSSGGTFGKAWTNLPNFPEWEADIDWKALGITNTEHSLTLLSEIGTARAALADLWDYDDEAAYQLAREKGVEKALASLKWAADLRRSLGLQKRKVSDHDVADYLKEREEDYAERRAQEAARVEKMQAELGMNLV